MLQRDIRNMNRRLIFDLFRAHREMTRVDVARRSGLSMPSVLKAVQPFLDANVLTSLGEAATPIGRKPLMLRFNPDAIAAFGVEFEGDRLSVGLVRIDGSIERKVVQHVKHTFSEDLVRAILSGIDELRASFDDRSRRLAGIGIGIPGAVDPSGRSILFAPLIGVEDPLDASPLLARIEAATGLPVLMENDANVAAVGEHLIRGGSLPGLPDDLLYVSLGTGLGGGLILDGTLRRGAHFLCGEIGYYTSTAATRASTREQGWLESRLNVAALESRFGPLTPTLSGNGELLSYVADHLAPALANLTSVLDIDRIVLGGVVVDTLGQPLVDRIAQAVERLALHRIDVTAALSPEPGIIGAATLVIESRLDELVAME
jgi:predicted NBD/HSP70 family sugar kinase